LARRIVNPPLPQPAAPLALFGRGSRPRDNADDCAVFRAQNCPVMKRWTAHLLMRIRMP
jgi:hypothetical protein